MSVAGKSMSLLLRRCFGPLTATRTRTLCVFLQRPSWPSSSRPGSVRNLRPWSIFTSQDRFCTTVLEEKTFPSSQVNEDEPEKKDVFVVHVRGFHRSSTSADLLQFFSDCNVSNGESGIHLMRNADGRPSGQAFVELKQVNDLRRALEKHKSNLGDRFVKVYELTNQEIEEIIQSSADTRVVRVRGLPRSCTEDEVNLFFKGLQINQDGIFLVQDSRGRCTGTGFVQFSTKEEADEALKRDKSYIGSRYIKLYPSNAGELLSSRLTSKSSSGRDQQHLGNENIELSLKSADDTDGR